MEPNILKRGLFRWKRNFRENVKLENFKSEIDDQVMIFFDIQMKTK